MSDDTKAVVRDPTTQRGHQAFERLHLFSHVLNRYCFRGDQPPDDEELDKECGDYQRNTVGSLYLI